MQPYSVVLLVPFRKHWDCEGKQPMLHSVLCCSTVKLDKLNAFSAYDISMSVSGFNPIINLGVPAGLCSPVFLNLFIISPNIFNRHILQKLNRSNP